MEKHDIFVGNLPFTATEEQLIEHFSLVGPVKKVRMLNDKDTGRLKGFAFVEYFDALVALAAIRHLNNTDLGGKLLRVGYASNSTLREKAKELGQDIPDIGGIGTTQSTVSSMPLHEAWDILDSMKRLVDEDRTTAKTLLETYPQLVFALHEIQRRLGIVSTGAAIAPSGSMTSASSVPSTYAVPEFTFTVPDQAQLMAQGMFQVPQVSGQYSYPIQQQYISNYGEQPQSESGNYYQPQQQVMYVDPNGYLPQQPNYDVTGQYYTTDQMQEPQYTDQSYSWG